ncbi:MAG TPA: hypothetical protein VNQ76_07155 [Planctomicrobium sp.]|nr:hypothetical protein [Planctomicrobium sp.]
MIRLFSIAILLAILFVQQPALGGGYGSVEGQVILDEAVPVVPPLVKKRDPNTGLLPVCGVEEISDESRQFDPETRGVANVFVYLRRPPTEIHPDLKSSTIPELNVTVENCRFHPHALVVRTGQMVVFSSEDDAVSHSLNVNPFTSGSFSLTIPPAGRESMRFAFPKPELLPLKIQCDIHPWMTAWWLVLDHPYAAITDEQGKFKIENLPEGEQEFRVWHENAGYIARKLSVTIKAGETTSVAPLEVPLSAFERK